MVRSVTPSSPDVGRLVPPPRPEPRARQVRNAPPDLASARPILIVNAGADPARLIADHAIEGQHLECSTVLRADELFQAHPDAELLAMVCDGRDWIVARALDRLKLSAKAAPPCGGLFSRRELFDEIALWIERTSASLRLLELDALNAASRADARVQLMIEHPRMITATGGREVPLWRWWLTEDDQSVFRSAAGSLLAELGYDRRADRSHP